MAESLRNSKLRPFQGPLLIAAANRTIAVRWARENRIPGDAWSFLRDPVQLQTREAPPVHWHTSAPYFHDYAALRRKARQQGAIDIVP